MPVEIGAKTHNFTDPTGLLSDCHRRIEMFMGTLKAVAAVIDRPPAEDTVRALESALRYFGEAAPKHTADEEVSLFPRLRQMGLPEIDSAFAELEHLEDEHRWAAPLHAITESSLWRTTRAWPTGCMRPRSCFDNGQGAGQLSASLYTPRVDQRRIQSGPYAEQLEWHYASLAMKHC